MSSISEAQAQAREVAACDRNEQVRRLRQTKKYRTAEFARAYLERLSELRFTNPKQAASLAKVVAHSFLPLLELDTKARLELHCRTLCILASAYTRQGDLNRARRALLPAIHLANRVGLECRGDLQQGLTALMMEEARYEDALAINRHAIFSLFEDGNRRDLGRSMVQRGWILSTQKHHAEASVWYRRAMDYLVGEEGFEIERCRFTAHTALGWAAHDSGDLREADYQVSQALPLVKESTSSWAARLLWLSGFIAYQRGELQRVQAQLSEAASILERLHDTGFLEVGVVLVEVLAEVGRSADARLLATRLYAFAAEFPDHKRIERDCRRIAQAAVRGEARALKRAIDSLRRSISADPLFGRVPPSPTGLQ